MTTVTAGTLKTGALEPVLEAKAVNSREPRVIEREITGLRTLAAVAKTSPQHEAACLAVSTLARDLREGLLLSHQEGELEMAAAGTLDDVVRVMRGRELNDPSHQPWSAKALARRLRGPLGVIAAPADHDALVFVDAVRVLDTVLARVPRAQLLTGTLRHEIGHSRYLLLQQLIAERGTASAC